MTGEPVDRRLTPGADPEDAGVLAEDPEASEGPQRHRHLPVLPVLAARGELGIPEVIAIGRVDFADQLAQLWVGEVSEFTELAVTQTAVGHRGTVSGRR
jgi:hypothetical protein